MSKSTKAEEEVTGKKTYCLKCKKFTLTIITPDTGIFGLWPFKAKRRLCRDCANPKSQTEVEQ